MSHCRLRANASRASLPKSLSRSGVGASEVSSRSSLVALAAYALFVVMR